MAVYILRVRIGGRLYWWVFTDTKDQLHKAKYRDSKAAAIATLERRLGVRFNKHVHYTGFARPSQAAMTIADHWLA